MIIEYGLNVINTSFGALVRRVYWIVDHRELSFVDGLVFLPKGIRSARVGKRLRSLNAHSELLAKALSEKKSWLNIDSVSIAVPHWQQAL